MIISPPFLPEQGSAGHADDEAYVESAMLDSMDKVIATGGAPAGSYPLGAALTWHNGLHLRAPSDATQQGRLPVRAIADGTVIFKRAPKPANTDATDPQNYNPSGSEASWTDNGIVIVRHTTDIGATDSTPTSVTYFSVYMHLSSIEDTVLENKPIWRKDKIGKAGQIFGQDNQIHFEICMDAANLQKLVGASRPISWTDPSVAPTAHGRTDAVFGSVYIYLPVGTPTSTTPPSNHISRPKAGASAATDHFVPDTLREPQWVEISYSKGQGTVRSYRVTDAEDGAKAGTPIGKPLAEPDFEYNLYTEANKRHNSLDTATQISSSPSGWYELLRFGRNLGPDNLPRNAAHWRQIPTANGTVWADLNADNTFKFSDADFPAFKGWQFFDDDTSQDDQRCDSVELKRLIRDPQAPESIKDHRSLANRLGISEIREQLKHAVCKFPTEWDKSTVVQRYEWLKTDEQFEVAPGKPWDDFQGHCEAITFSDLPQEYKTAVWRFHPRAFISHLRNCGWLSLHELGSTFPRHLFYEGNGNPRRALTKPPIYVLKREEANSRLSPFHIPLNRAIRKYIGNSKQRVAIFLAQALLETAQWRNLGGRKRLMHEWGFGAFSTANTATQYYGPFYGRGIMQLTWAGNYMEYGEFRKLAEHHLPYMDHLSQPPRISGNSMHYKFHPNDGGRQIVWAPRYDPDILGEDPNTACDSGGFYWVSKTFSRGININRIADEIYNTANVGFINRLVNGGGNGYYERQAYSYYAIEALTELIQTASLYAISIPRMSSVEVNMLKPE